MTVMEKVDPTNIDRINRVIMAKGQPWMTEGTKVSEKETLPAILKASGLDWTVQKRQLLADLGKGKTTPVPNRYGLIRSDNKKLFGVCSGGWEDFSNQEAIKFMRDYARAGGVTLESVGSLQGGMVVFGLAKLKKGFEVTKGDKVNGFLLLLASHQVGRSHSIRGLTLRLACNNGLGIAEDGEIAYTQNHMSVFNVDLAKERVGIAYEHLGAAERRAKTIAKLKISDDDAIRKVLMPVFFPKIVSDKEAMKEAMKPGNLPRRITDILTSVNKAPGAVPGNGWGVLNGVTHYLDHIAGNKSSQRMFRGMVGDYSVRKIEVESRLMELAA